MAKLNHNVKAAADASPADWIVSNLRGFLDTVISVVPDGFDTYWCIKHPDTEGTLPTAQAKKLATVLPESPDKACFFALWEGYGGFPILATVPRFQTRGREYGLFCGVLSDASTAFDHMTKSRYPPLKNPKEIHWQQTPNLWWPSNRKWCVATEIDLEVTLIGCDSFTGSALEAMGAESVKPHDELPR